MYTFKCYCFKSCQGRNLDEAVEKAKAYISGALGAMLDLGKGSGPMNHAFAVEGEY